MDDERTIIKVDDLIKYLQTLPPDLRVELDKDGWSYGKNITDAQEIIRGRGLFYIMDDCVIINN